jgi:signal recognition particle subunit SRP54
MSDVDVELVAELSGKIKKKVLDEKPPAGMTVRDYFIKTLYDEIVYFLGEEKAEVALKKQKIIVVGLFGSGKTTTIGKVAKWFKVRGLKVGAVACDTHRPAAQDQLEQIGQSIGIAVYREGKSPLDIANKAMEKSREDVLIFDSAGRDALDKNMAKELKEMGEKIKPDEVLLVIPADIGQAARKQAEEFSKLVGITGIVVTKLDGTAKGGGALAAAHVSGAKVKFIGVGEKPDDIEVYDPRRFVSRLIGYGDIQGLLDKAKQAGVEVSEEKARKLLEGKFTMLDFQDQIKQLRKMGSMSKFMEMVPGVSGMKIPGGLLDVQEGKMKKWPCMIDSMTKDEREDPEIIKHARVQRIARGSGCQESEVRELLKYYKQIKKVMKLTKGGKGLKRGPLAQLVKQFGFGGQ